MVVVVMCGLNIMMMSMCTVAMLSECCCGCCSDVWVEHHDDEDVYNANVNANDEDERGRSADVQPALSDSRRQKTSAMRSGARSPAVSTAVQLQLLV